MLGSQGKGHKKKQTRKRGAKSSKKFQKGDCQPHSTVAVRADVCATPVKHDKAASTVVSRMKRAGSAALRSVTPKGLNSAASTRVTSPLRWINFPVRDGKGIQMPADESTPRMVPDTPATADDACGKSPTGVDGNASPAKPRALLLDLTAATPSDGDLVQIGSPPAMGPTVPANIPEMGATAPDKCSHNLADGLPKADTLPIVDVTPRSRGPVQTARELRDTFLFGAGALRRRASKTGKKALNVVKKLASCKACKRADIKE